MMSLTAIRRKLWEGSSKDPAAWVTTRPPAAISQIFAREDMTQPSANSRQWLPREHVTAVTHGFAEPAFSPGVELLQSPAIQ